MSNIRLLSLICLFLASINVYSMSGNQYLDSNESVQIGYIIGAVDYRIVSEVVNKGEKSQTEKCVKDLPYKQIKAMFDKELRDNPERWNLPASFILGLILNSFCDGVK